MRDPREVCILEAGARRRPGKELRPMTTYDDKYFEEMAEAAKKGEFTPIPNTLLTGEEARQSALAMLKAATGTDDYTELVKMTRGRRKLSEQKEQASQHSPVLHMRLPEELNKGLRNI